MSYEEEIAWGVQQMLDADLQFPQDVPVRNVVKTNADHIRSMTDEELAKWLCEITTCESCAWAKWTGCEVRNWLKQPYKEET